MCGSNKNIPVYERILDNTPSVEGDVMEQFFFFPGTNPISFGEMTAILFVLCGITILDNLHCNLLTAAYGGKKDFGWATRLITVLSRSPKELKKKLNERKREFWRDFQSANCAS